ncbi:hypothetical protein [Carnobacterium funditum]|nr:hypothetical protein [Carnobacterium funditum]
MKTKRLVVGSISTDFVVEALRIPKIEETMEGNSFQTNDGLGNVESV